MVITTGWAMAVVVAVYAVGRFSGAHLNPAINLGLAVIGSFSWSAVPIYMHLDHGHAAPVFDDPTHGLRDKDPYAWMAERWGDNRLVLVHAQQCDAAASRHWPFTAAYNAKGIIDARRCIEAFESSNVEYAVFALEILFPRGTRIEVIEPAIVESAEYWRDALESLGYKRGRNGYYAKK
jgi:hypothetical protein